MQRWMRHSLLTHGRHTSLTLLALSSEDLARHRQQLAHVQEICLLFEKSDPNSKAPPTRVIELMQEVRVFVRENGRV